MYEGLRLTELHEEWAWSSEAARRFGGGEGRAHAQQRDRFDAEIRARVAVQQPAGAPPRTGCAVAMVQAGVPLKYGTPDAARKYPGRYDHWSCHARHAVPVEGCHLCREGRR